MAPLENSTGYTISSGVEAISFTPLYDTGGNFAAQNPVEIDATRLITSPDEPCLIVVNGQPKIYFSSLNSTDHVLTVPLEYNLINSIYSVTGQAVPAESFAAGESGFTVPKQYFEQGATLMGVWKFLGLNISVSSTPPICTDRGVPGECEPIDPALLRSPFEYTRRVIVRLSKLSIDAAKSGRWKGANGKFSIPFLKRGAKALATMEQVFRDSSGLNFKCEITPMSCATKRLPKGTLRNAFKTIFDGQVPRGLEQIQARSKREIAAFELILKKLPTQYTKCE